MEKWPQQAFLSLSRVPCLDASQTCMPVVRQKQNQASSDVFCQNLVVQLGGSDAEEKPQLVTEVLPGLTELLQTQGRFCKMIFFSSFFFRKREFLSRGCDCNSQARLAAVAGRRLWRCRGRSQSGSKIAAVAHLECTETET